MANRIQLRSGNRAPTYNDLLENELGVYNKKIYMGLGGTTDPLVINPDIPTIPTDHVTLGGTQTITGIKTFKGDNFFQGEQKFSHPTYCPEIADAASGVGCAFKASRGLFNEALIDKIIMTGTTSKIPFYKYAGTSSGSMTGLTEVASINKDGGASFTGPITVKGDKVLPYKILYDGSSTGSVELSESAANFSYFEIIVDYSDNVICASLKVPSPNNKTVDVSAAFAPGDTGFYLANSRIRLLIVNQTVTVLANRRVYFGKTDNTWNENPNNLRIKQIIGYR